MYLLNQIIISKASQGYKWRSKIIYLKKHHSKEGYKSFKYILILFYSFKYFKVNTKTLETIKITT